MQLGEQAAVGSWSEEEARGSSTFRELRGARRVLESFAPQRKGREVLHRTDNKNAKTILSVGSHTKNLHQEAVMIYELCRKYNIYACQWNG